MLVKYYFFETIHSVLPAITITLHVSVIRSVKKQYFLDLKLTSFPLQVTHFMLGNNVSWNTTSQELVQYFSS